MANNRENRLAGATNKQKVMVVVFIIVVVIIIWQVIGLFSGGSSVPADTSTATAPTAPKNPTAINNATKPMNPNIPGASNSPNTLPNKPPLAAFPTPVLLGPAANHPENEIVKVQQQTQVEFLKAVDQLQILKVQREIAETKQAISAATLATVTADKNMSNLLTPTLPPPVPQSTYAANLSAPTQLTPNNQAPTNVPPPPVATPVETAYVVISVTMQFNRWNAVLGYQGKFYSVGVGDTLPVDNSVVTNISNTGVTLIKDGKRRKLSLVSSI